jgi:hypothetical protein
MNPWGTTTAERDHHMIVRPGEQPRPDTHLIQIETRPAASDALGSWALCKKTGQSAKGPCMAMKVLTTETDIALPSRSQLRPVISKPSSFGKAVTGKGWHRDQHRSAPSSTGKGEDRGAGRAVLYIFAPPHSSRSHIEKDFLEI